ncbi:hypothetical protein BC1002_5728 [Paraburkholderia atlantica]|uniref:Uncharacterized protein n=1 Tax=Paraburkholderia atlantica TaxID=2654982 RepID=D5WK79_PARAM|nr:hypothetical protein BC1002_5728 [Paraburkholderia atlantica]
MAQQGRDHARFVVKGIEVRGFGTLRKMKEAAALTRYCDEGQLEIDSLPVEGAQREFPLAPEN